MASRVTSWFPRRWPDAAADPPRERCYRYAETVRYTIQALHLTPRREVRQHVGLWSIAAPGGASNRSDAHDNVVHYLTMESPHRELRLVVAGVVETDEVEGQPNSAHATLSPLAYRLGHAADSGRMRR